MQKENSIKLIVILILSIFAIINQSIISIMCLSVFIIVLVVRDALNTERNLSRLKRINIETEKKARSEIDNAYERTVQLINAIPSPLVYISQRGDFSVMNQYFKSLINVDASNVYDVYIDTQIRQTMLDAFLNEKQFVRQLSYKEIDFQVLSIPFFNDKKRYDGCMLIFQDITRVLEGEKIQKRFIADASHELRTPITSIKGMIEILNREGFSDESTRIEFLKQIEKENNRLDHIVEDLLLQSRLKSNTLYLEKTVFNLKRFFDGIIYEKRQDLHLNSIKVTLNCPSDILIYADQFRLTQVFINLINNSINYAEGGIVTVSADSQDGNAIIHFKDSGKGISDELLPHIFDRFFRGDVNRSRENGGTGLGLAISKSIIEAHGGTITVNSKEDEGTVFTIVIPHQ